MRFFVIFRSETAIICFSVPNSESPIFIFSVPKSHIFFCLSEVFRLKISMSRRRINEIYDDSDDPDSGKDSVTEIHPVKVVQKERSWVYEFSEKLETAGKS
jgi:hypothetical protein